MRAALLRWYARAHRDLPWRRTRDPYAIWVSEVMLQQTQVAVVVRYYEKFLARFPDLRTLARASEEQVLALWSGLGYYTRARSLHRGAKIVLERHGGRLPGDPAELRAIPGIGRYTAGAIASIAYDREEPVLDGNVRRVLSRLLAIRRPGERHLWEVAQALVRGARPGALNQALMELGAVLCTPRAPRCTSCPVSKTCRARASGDPEAYPEKRRRSPTVRARVAVAIVRRSGAVLIERRTHANPLRGAWELPAVEVAAGEEAPRRLQTEMRRRHRLPVEVGAKLGSVMHSILNRRLSVDAYDSRLVGAALSRPGPALRWLDRKKARDAPLSAATWKVLDLLEESPGRGRARSGRTSLP